MNTLKSALVICFFALSLFSGAQNFEGLVIYKVDYLTVPEGMSEDRLCEQIYLYTNGDQHRIEEKGIASGNVFLYSTGYPFETVLLNWLGHPVALSQSLNYPESPLSLEAKTSTVAGQTCSLVKLNEQLVFCADELKGQFPWLPMLEQLPLSFSIERNGCEMQVTAIQIEHMPIDIAYFQVPKEYSMMDKAELQELFGEFDTEYSEE